MPQVEAVDLVVAGEGAAHAPLDAFGGDALVDTEAVEDFERFLGVADAARGGTLDADGVVFVEQYGLYAESCEGAGEGEAGDAAADDDDGVSCCLCVAEFGRGDEGVLGQDVAAALGELVAVGVGGFFVARLVHCLSPGASRLSLIDLAGS